jgi:hypothetical protein
MSNMDDGFMATYPNPYRILENVGYLCTGISLNTEMSSSLIRVWIGK